MRVPNLIGLDELDLPHVFRNNILIIGNEKACRASTVKKEFDLNRLVDVECKCIIDIEQEIGTLHALPALDLDEFG